MPTATAADLMLLHIATCSQAQIALLPAGNGRYPLPIAQLLQQVTSDRLSLAGDHLHTADQLMFAQQFRSAISRHYYAMYHAARAVVFAETGGDDHQQHSVLPRHLPPGMANAQLREIDLTDARLLRNRADYDPYPVDQMSWRADAMKLAAVAAGFVQACEDFALSNGYV